MRFFWGFGTYFFKPFKNIIREQNKRLPDHLVFNRPWEKK